MYRSHRNYAVSEVYSNLTRLRGEAAENRGERERELSFSSFFHMFVSRHNRVYRRDTFNLLFRADI